MKAIICTRYGSFNCLKPQQVSKPSPSGDQVLIKVHASSINDWDAARFRGTPYILRLNSGLFVPKPMTPGCDIAGEVEAVGGAVRRFKAGDAVYGDIHGCGFGGFAEYACVSEAALEPKPQKLSFEQAAAIPHAATLAWQSLTGYGGQPIALKTGQRLLINGAAGGVGTIAGQWAKLQGLEVTGVDCAQKLGLLDSLGFDQVIDFQKQDFTKSGQQYDIILDVKTKHSPYAYVKALKPGGIYTTVGGSLWRMLQIMLSNEKIKKKNKKDIRIQGLEANRGLAELAPLFESGSIAPVLDGPFTLSQMPEAMKYYLQGKAKGRVVITMG